MSIIPTETTKLAYGFGKVTRHQMVRANLEPKLLPAYVREV